MFVAMKGYSVAAPKIRGIGPRLKGKTGKMTNLAFSAKDVQEGAKLVIAGTSETGTAYEWKATFDAMSLSKKKIQVECTKGDAQSFRRGRYRGQPYGAGDVVDVDFTIINPSGETTTIPQVVEIDGPVQA